MHGSVQYRCYGPSGVCDIGSMGVGFTKNIDSGLRGYLARNASGHACFASLSESIAGSEGLCACTRCGRLVCRSGMSWVVVSPSMVSIHGTSCNLRVPRTNSTPGIRYILPTPCTSCRCDTCPLDSIHVGKDMLAIANLGDSKIRVEEGHGIPYSL